MLRKWTDHTAVCLKSTKILLSLHTDLIFDNFSLTVYMVHVFQAWILKFHNFSHFPSKEVAPMSLTAIVLQSNSFVFVWLCIILFWGVGYYCRYCSLFAALRVLRPTREKYARVGPRPSERSEDRRKSWSRTGLLVDPIFREPHKA